MKMLAGIVATLTLAGVTAAYAQIIYPGAPHPYPGAPYLYSSAPYVEPQVVVAPAPYGGAYIPGPYPGSAVVNPYTGRWCTFEPTGWHWCWTP
jgi:hypothetical protein